MANYSALAASRASELQACAVVLSPGKPFMRFTIEKRPLTDSNGKPLPTAADVEFLTCDADTVDDAVRLFVRKEEAEVIGNVLTFPGFQAIATVRKQANVFTIQVGPASDLFVR